MLLKQPIHSKRLRPNRHRRRDTATGSSALTPNSREVVSNSEPDRSPGFRVFLLATPSHPPSLKLRWAVAWCGVRQRLQLRGSAGFAPASQSLSVWQLCDCQAHSILGRGGCQALATLGGKIFPLFLRARGAGPLRASYSRLLRPAALMSSGGMPSAAAGESGPKAAPLRWGSAMTVPSRGASGALARV